MILTESGEIGIFTDAGEAVLRPSLYAISRLGSPRDIVEQYALIMTEFDDERLRRQQLDAARRIILACGREADQDLLFRLYGYMGAEGDELKWVPGEANPEHILPLARSLMRHGVTGVNPPEKRRGNKEPEYSEEFIAKDFVAAAIAHLGMTEREAWDATMTMLVAALRAKFPPMESNEPGARAPTKEEHEETMAWYDRVEAARKKKLH